MRSSSVSLDDDELSKVQLLMLWEIASIVDHRPVNSQVVKHFFGDKSEETKMENEGVTFSEDQGRQLLLWLHVTAWTWLGVKPVSIETAFGNWATHGPF